jgi:hypothetical protein
MDFFESLLIFFLGGIVGGFIVATLAGNCASAQSSFKRDTPYCNVKYKDAEVAALCRELDLHKNEFAKYISLHLNDNAHGEIRGRRK